MAITSSYNLQNYLPKHTPGMTIEDNHSDKHIVATVNAGLTTVADNNIVSNTFAQPGTQANETIVAILNTQYGQILSDIYPIPSTGFDPVLFSNWISTVFAGFVTFSDTQNWGLVAPVKVRLADPVAAASVATPSIRIYNTNNPTVNTTPVITLNTLPSVRVQPGVIVVRNTPLDGAALLNNQNFLHSYKTIDSAATAAAALSNGGVTAVPSYGYANNIQGLNSTGMFDKIRVYKRALVIVATSATATFNAAGTDTLLVETATGADQGKVTNVASASTVALPTANYQIVYNRNFIGGIAVQLNCN